MSKRIKFKLIAIIIAVFMFLFPCGNKLGYNTHNEDKGPAIEDSSIIWKFTYYNDGKTGGLGHTNPLTNSSFEQSDWTINETYGWHEWEYKGTKYVVMAAATCEGIDELPHPIYPFIKEQSKVHYFHYGTAANNWNYSTFKFRFVDNGDTNEYNGIVLDTCAVALDPWNSGWNSSEWDGNAYGAKAEGEQILDVHVPLGYPETSKYEKFNGKQVNLSSTGTWSSSDTGESSSSSKMDFFVELAHTIFTALGDGIEIGLNKLATNMSKEDSKKLEYSKSDIQKNKELQSKIHVGDAYEFEMQDGNKDNRLTKKDTAITISDISNYTDNKKGRAETIYKLSTPIPYMAVDMYSSAIGKFNCLDVDFFNKNNKNEDKTWNFAKNLITTSSHIILYLSAILLILMIVLRAIFLVINTMRSNPESAAKEKRILDNIIKAVIIISTIYLMMIFLIYFCEQIINLIINNDDTEFLIKLNVEDVYSFDTNTVGYLKYMSLSSNMGVACGYSFLYLLYQIFNALFFVIMYVRVWLIVFMLIIAPLTAVYSMIGKSKANGFMFSNILDFGTFMNVYCKILFAPPIIITFIVRMYLMVT